MSFADSKRIPPAVRPVLMTAPAVQQRPAAYIEPAPAYSSGSNEDFEEILETTISLLKILTLQTKILLRRLLAMADRPERESAAVDARDAKVCSFCVDRADYIDYKDIAKLRRFISERGKILPAV